MATSSSLLGRGLGLVLVEFQYEYEGREGELVSIKPNERYVLLAKTNDHWWQVRRDSSSKPFYIPAKYVKELPADFPSPLDFTNPPPAEPAQLPVAAPVPVPVPVPKPLEEARAKAGDEVTIRLRPDSSTRYHKTENRMSTFGVPLDFHEPSPPRHPSIPPASRTETKSTASSETTNTADKFLDDHVDSGTSRVPSFSPADPLPAGRAHTQPIPVEMPVVPPHCQVHSISSSSTDHQNNQEEEEEEEEELVEEEVSTDGSAEDQEEPVQTEDSHHIYESIQDLNLDLEALVGEKVTPAVKPEPEPEPAAPSTQEQHLLAPVSPIYANVSSLKKTAPPLVSVSGPEPSSQSPTDPTPPTSGHTPSSLSHTPSSSVSSSGLISPASPVSPQCEWQAHTDQDSGKVFYYHPLTRQTTWSQPQSPPPSPGRDMDESSGREMTSPSSLLSPASPQIVSGWEQLMDEVSGRFYYYNPTTRATSWSAPDQLPPSSPPGSSSGGTEEGPPPLPVEDYPVSDNNDNVFTTQAQQPAGLIPRAQLDLKDSNSLQRRQPEFLLLPQRLMGNGVSEEGQQVKNWRHSVAEDSFSLSHRRNVSDFAEIHRKPSPDSPPNHLLEKAGILNKTKVADNGKKIRKNWSQSWTVLHGGILTFHRDPKSAPAGNASKASQIVPEYTVELRGSSVSWTSNKSSKKNVMELKTRQGCEYLMQYDTESIICDWYKVILDTIKQLEQEHVSEDEDELSDKEDKDRKRTTSRSSSGPDSEQRRVRTKLRRFLQRRPTLQSVREKGYIRDNVFGCHLDVLCHRENSTIPKFVEKCIRTVERRGLDVDGIYRVSGNLAVIQKLRHKADHEEQLDLEDGQWEEIHVVTGALKLFLRELPEPIFPFSCFDKFIAAIQVPDYTLRVSYMKDLVQTLPLPNHDTMELLFRHLRKVIDHRDSNRMSVQSVSIVFGPTLLRPQTESSNMTIHMVFQSQIVELLLNEYHTVFFQR